MALLRVRLTPRAAQNAIGAFDADGVLHVRVTAPPADQKANDALVRLLASALDVSASRVHIARGASARTKTVEVEGLSDAEVRSLLG
jgi:uncharacterized protein (TIGR00251 family)